MKEALDIGMDAWQLTTTVPNATMFKLGIAGTLSAYIVQAWTAFEALAGDLWECALNIHPELLAQLSGSKSSDAIEPNGKMVNLETLQRYGYDLKSVMGSVLRAKFKFDSLDGIREAYRAAFGKNDAGAIVSALEDGSLTAANAIRQVLVHRGGTVDDKYVRRTKNAPLAPKLEVGSELVLDGKIVYDLLSAAVPQVVTLVKSVDEWMVAHTAKA